MSFHSTVLQYYREAPRAPPFERLVVNPTAARDAPEAVRACLATTRALLSYDRNAFVLLWDW